MRSRISSSDRTLLNLTIGPIENQCDNHLEVLFHRTFREKNLVVFDIFEVQGKLSAISVIFVSKAVGAVERRERKEKLLAKDLSDCLNMC